MSQDFRASIGGIKSALVRIHVALHILMRSEKGYLHR